MTPTATLQAIPEHYADLAKTMEEAGFTVQWVKSEPVREDVRPVVYLAAISRDVRIDMQLLAMFHDPVSFARAEVAMHHAGPSPVGTTVCHPDRPEGFPL